MPPTAVRPAALAWRIFRGSDAIRRGLLTADQLRGRGWVRLGRDVYADTRLDRHHRLACQAVALGLPPSAILAGPSAAYLHGVEHAAGFGDDVHVLLPRPVRLDSRRGLRVHSTALPLVDGTGTGAAPDQTLSARALSGRALSGGAIPGRRSSVGGLADCGSLGGGVGALARSSPARAAWETAVWLEPVRAVGIVDSLLRQGLVTRTALDDLAERYADRRGGRRARRVFDLADPGAQSPQESQLRVRLVLAGLPRPVVQHPVRLPDGLILHPDLAWPQFKVAVEYDGHWHADAEQLHRDRRRLNRLVGAGWLVLHVTSRRLRADLGRILGEVRSALISRGWRPVVNS